METASAKSERIFEAAVTFTIGGFVLITGLFFLLSYTPPCSFPEEVVCGPAPLYAGIIATVVGAVLLAVGLVRAAVVPGAHRKGAKIR